MSKMICDVCGTTYPETAAQCPICGCAKNTTQQTAAGEQTPGDAPYTYVKGGRFSKANVRKRYQPGAAPERRVAKERQPKKEGGDNTNKILAIVIVVLLLAIAAVLVYMGVRVFFPNLGQPAADPTESTQQTEDKDPTGGTESMPLEVPCAGLELTKTTIEFIKAGDGYLLAAILSPADTTDTVTYTSGDPAVATVTDTGMVTAVAGGQTTITVTCGSQTAQCQVICSFGDVTAPTEEPTTPAVTVPEGYTLKLRHDDITMSTRYPGPEALFKKDSKFGIKATDITWTVDDPTVAAVDEKGVVTAVGKGNTWVHATIGDQKASCKVIVAFDPKPETEQKYKLSHTDVTLYVNGNTQESSFRISLTDKDGVNVEAEWTVSHEGYVSINNRNIKAVKVTSELPQKAVTITATVDGETYTCIVRVAEKKTEE